MKKMLNSPSKYKELGMFLLVTFLVAALLLFIFTAMKCIHHHESAYTLLYGQNVLEHGLYSKTFSGREVAFLTWAPVSALVQYFFGFNLTSHSITSALFLVLVIIVAISVSRALKLTFIAGLALLAFLIINPDSVIINPDSISIPYRWFDQVWLWPMNSYGIYDVFSLILVIFTYKHFLEVKNSTSRKTLIIYLSFFYVFSLFFIFSLNGIRGFLTITLPVLLGYYLVHKINSEKIVDFNFKRPIKIFMAAIFGVLIGILINKLAAHGAINEIQNSHTFFSKPDIGIKTIQFFEKWFSLFNAVPVEGTPIISLEGGLIFTKFFIASFLLFIPMFYRRRFLTHSSLATFFYYKFCVIFLIVFFAYVFGSSHQERYLIPLAFSSFILAAIFIDDYFRNLNKLGILLLLLVCIVSFQNIVFYVKNSVNYLENSDLYLSKNQSYRLSKFLESKGLYYGYETRWYRQTLPVNLYSGRKIFLGLLEEDFTPHFHSDIDWFNDRSRVFLIVDNDDLKLNPYVIYLLKNFHNVVYDFEGRKILSFDQFPSEIIFKDKWSRCKINTAISDHQIPFVMRRPGDGIGCENWGGIVNKDGKFGKYLNGHAKFYLRLSKPVNKVMFEISSFDDSYDKNNSCFSIYKGNAPILSGRLSNDVRRYNFLVSHKDNEATLHEFRFVSCSGKTAIYDLVVD